MAKPNLITQQILVGFCLLAVILVFMFFVRVDKELTAETSETPFNKPMASSVVTQILSSKLKPDKAGQITLSPPMDTTTKGGLVTVHHGKSGLVLIFFPTDYERFGVIGYLYCSRPLIPSDMSPGAIHRIAIESSMYPSNNGSTTHGKGHIIIVPLTRQVDAHWWRIVGPTHEV